MPARFGEHSLIAAAHFIKLPFFQRKHPPSTLCRYSKLQTLAGVSCGSVVVAMLAVGCGAEELFAIVQSLPFQKLFRPELGALMRAAGRYMYPPLTRYLSNITQGK